MKLTEKINLAFAAYGIFYGVMLGVTVTIAFYVIEDAILDYFLVRAVDQVTESAVRGREPVLPSGMTLYTGDAPVEVAGLPEGRHEIAQYKHVAVFADPLGGGMAYLVADQTTAELDVVLRRILFGTLLALVLAMLVALVLARLLSGQLMRPMKHLVQRIDELDLANPSLQPLPRDDEIGFLSERFSKAVDLLKEHDVRERNFTRYASHELRTPITVLSGTVAILKSESTLSPRAERALTRAGDAVERMSRLVEAFLFLGRDADDGMLAIVTAAQVEGEIATLANSRSSAGDRLSVNVSVEDGEYVSNLLLLSIVLENLIGNAVRHGAGELEVRLASPTITLRNPVAAGSEAGHGFGIEIAQKLCERIGFELSIERNGEYYAVTLKNVARSSAR